ncbi:MAG TPA: hypothetical protein DD381_10115 [Lentisphaeria bacterium]|nr:MAG: hypothetical protein A2X47_11890 [Lentisphaerae bacterium GWF2_38_69]HBM16679.1 hypothetical protein [Lentisphaeria bacterium]
MNEEIKVDAKLKVAVESKDGLTIPSEIFCSQPYKLTNFFRLPSGGIEYILMNSSAGIMAGDKYQIDIDIKKGSILSLLSQSYEKIHKMDEGCASRNTTIKIGDSASLKYFPLPIIPFAGSAFKNSTDIRLANANSKLIYADFISSGRYHNNERFNYKYFISKTNVFMGDKLIYRENSSFQPEQANLYKLGLFENYDCLANVLLYGFDSARDKVRDYLSMAHITGIEAAITEMPYCGTLIRGLGNESSRIQKFINQAINTILPL